MKEADVGNVGDVPSVTAKLHKLLVKIGHKNEVGHGETLKRDLMDP